MNQTQRSGDSPLKATFSPAFGKREETAGMERSRLEVQLPNHFVLKGAVTKITYDFNTVTGKPKFVYEGAFGSKTFVGAGIRDTEICHMITVKVRDTNQEVTTLTVLIPTVTLKRDGSTSFTAMAIFTTTHRGTGFEGPLRAYDVEKLTGEALFVESLRLVSAF